MAYLALGHLPTLGAVRGAHEEAPRAEHLDPPAAGQQDARGEGFHLAHLAPEGGRLGRRRGGGGGVAFEAAEELGRGLVEDGVDELGVADVADSGGPRAPHAEHRPGRAVLARGAVLSGLALRPLRALFARFALFPFLALLALRPLLAAAGAGEREGEGARLAPFEVDKDDLRPLVGRQGRGREGGGARGRESAPGGGAEAPVGGPRGGGLVAAGEGEGRGAARGVERDGGGRERLGADSAVGGGREGLGGGVGPKGVGVAGGGEGDLPSGDDFHGGAVGLGGLVRWVLIVAISP